MQCGLLQRRTGNHADMAGIEHVPFDPLRILDGLGCNICDDDPALVRWLL